MTEQRRRCAVICILLCILTISSVGQRAPSTAENRDSDALAKTLNELIVNVPKWRALIAGVDLDALPIQYKEGKQIEFLRTRSLEELEEIEKLASSVEQKPTTWESVHLLLKLEDLYGGDLDHLASALMLVTGSDGKLIGQAVSWGKTLADTDSNIMDIEKRIEVPVMKMLMARDALLDVCKDKFTH